MVGTELELGRRIAGANAGAKRSNDGPISNAAHLGRTRFASLWGGFLLAGVEHKGRPRAIRTEKGRRVQ